VKGGYPFQVAGIADSPTLSFILRGRNRRNDRQLSSAKCQPAVKCFKCEAQDVTRDVPCFRLLSAVANAVDNDEIVLGSRVIKRTSAVTAGLANSKSNGKRAYLVNRISSAWSAIIRQERCTSPRNDLFKICCALAGCSFLKGVISVA